MRILLDTHIAIWAIADSNKLNNQVLNLLKDSENEVLYSIVSVCEIAIKHLINPSNMPVSEEEFVELCEQTGFSRLNISPEHIYSLKNLVRNENEPKHNDPFDRLLISQAKVDDLVFITHDALLSGYNEPGIMKV